MHFLAGVFCIWMSVWAIRRKAEVDYPLDTAGRVLRWAIVGVGFAISRIPGSPSTFGYVRLTGLVVGMVFLCWPNCAYHLRNLRSGQSD